MQRIKTVIEIEDQESLKVKKGWTWKKERKKLEAEELIVNYSEKTAKTVMKCRNWFKLIQIDLKLESSESERENKKKEEVKKSKQEESYPKNCFIKSRTSQFT